MEMMLVTFGLMGVLMLAMAVGVIFRGKPLKGSCGGVGNGCACEKAGRPGACEDGKGPPPTDDAPRDLGGGVLLNG